MEKVNEQGRPNYESPIVVSYDEEAMWQMLGPAQTAVSSTFTP